MNHAQTMVMLDSMKNHQITSKGIVGFAQKVTMISCDNPHIGPAAKGVLVICEQGTSLGVIVAVFHHLKDDGALGPPCMAKNPIYIAGHF